MVAALVVLSMGVAAAEIINTGRFVVQPDAVEDEDVYVAATTGTVDGRIEGDLAIAAESLDITGVVTGDLLVAVRDTVSISGTVEGSLRGVARRIELRGAVLDDVAAVAGSVSVTGSVGRDLIGLGASADVSGTVGRDIRGRFVSVDVSGAVARDVEVTVDRISVIEPAAVAGDVVYQAVDDVEIAPQAEIGGQVIKLPADMPFAVDLVLTVVDVVGFLGYLFGGILLIWLLRATAPRAIAAITLRTGRALAVGVAAIVLGPLGLVLLAASLVGIPLALLALGIMAVGVFFGSVPLVAAVGARVLGGRGGSYGGFLFGAVFGRLLAALWAPLGVAIYLVATVWGVGGWILGAWRSRAVQLPVSS